MMPFKFQYRCSQSHWVCSIHDDLEGGKCDAVFANGVRCDGALDYAMVYWHDVEDLIDLTNQKGQQ